MPRDSVFQVLDGLKDGNAALKKMHDLVSIDEIERIMDETQDGIEKQQVSWGVVRAVTNYCVRVEGLT